MTKTKIFQKFVTTISTCPKKVTLTHGEIAYTYDALGNKWFKYVGESNGQAGDEKHGTAYLFGFQYSFKYNDVVKYDWKLMHMATSEGYVSAVYPQGINDGFKLHYVYNHTDHLGNIRQNITRKGNEIDILKEDNYYPFGLTHRGYNEQKEELKYDPEQDRIFTIQAQASRYKYMFRDQERQTDIDLNRDSFKYRNYDYAIGRFFNVDPLAEDYPHMTVYQFAGNKPTWSRELEGMESAVDLKMRVLYDATHSKTDPQKFIKNTRLPGANNIKINADIKLTERDKLIINGSLNIISGGLGIVVSSAYILGTEGWGAALGGTTALTTSIGTVTVGTAQLIDAFSSQNNQFDNKLHKAKTIQGLLAYEADSKYAKEIDNISSASTIFLTGNPLKVGTTIKVLNAANNTYTAGSVIYDYREETRRIYDLITNRSSKPFNLNSNSSEQDTTSPNSNDSNTNLKTDNCSKNKTNQTSDHFQN